MRDSLTSSTNLLVQISFFFLHSIPHDSFWMEQKWDLFLGVREGNRLNIWHYSSVLARGYYTECKSLFSSNKVHSRPS